MSYLRRKFYWFVVAFLFVFSFSFFQATPVLASSIGGNSADTTLDSTVTLESDEISSVEKLVADVRFQNAVPGQGAVAITFSILDRDGNVFLTQSDTITLESQAIFVKRFEEVSNVPTGAYALHVRVEHGDHVDVFELPFTIVDDSRTSQWLIFALIWAVGIFIPLGLIKLAKKEQSLRLDGALVFFGSFVFSLVYMALWAWLFTGVWYDSRLEQDLPGVLMVPITLTIIYFTIKSYPRDHHVDRVVSGFSLFIVFFLVVVPLDKYFFEFPNYDVSTMAYLPLSTFAIINFSVIYSGLRVLIRSSKQPTV